MAIVLAVWGFIKLFFKLLKSVIQVLSGLIVFLGLYIPLFYVFFGLILLITTDFSFGGTGTDQILFYVGLGLSCIAALIISIRNLLVRPISSVFSSFRREEEPERRRSSPPDRRFRRYEDGGAREGYRREDGAYFYREDDSYGASLQAEDLRRAYSRNEYGDPSDFRSQFDPRSQRSYTEPYAPEWESRAASNVPIEREERPLVYYSKRRPGVLVKEYGDRFELFSESESGRRYIGTEYKDD